MASRIKSYTLDPVNPATQHLEMPRRARIVSATFDPSRKVVALYAIVEFEENLVGIEVAHIRHFVIVRPNELIPEGAGYIGGSLNWHVFEVRG